MSFLKNTADQHCAAQMNSRADGSPLTADVTVKVAKDGAGYGDGAGSASHLGGGAWDYVPTQAETNCEHLLVQFLHATGVYQLLNLYPQSSATAAPTVEEIRAEMDSNSSQLAAIVQDTGTDIPTLLGTIAGYIDTEVQAIKDKTDNLPLLPAAQGDIPSAATIAAAILETPANKIVTDGSGFVTANVSGTVEVSGEVVLAAAQPNYAPAKAGDEMALTAAYDAAKTAASQDSVDNLASKLSTIAPTTDAPDSEQVDAGSVISGSYLTVQTDDNNRYTLAPVSPGGLDVTLVFELGTDRAPIGVVINGYWSGSGQVCNVFAYDYENEIWDQLSNSTTQMKSRNGDTNYAYGLNREHIDPATGNVSIRFVSESTNTGHRLYLDMVLVSSVQSVAGTTVTVTGATAQEIWEYVSRTLTGTTGEAEPAPTVEEIRGEIDSNSTQLAAIKAKTDNIPSNPATLVNQQTIIAAIAEIPTDTGTGDATEDKQDAILAAIAALPTPGDATAAAQTSMSSKLDSIQGIVEGLEEGPGHGAGAIPWSTTVKTAEDVPIGDVDVWVTTDIAGENVIASGKTDQNGRVTFYLDAGQICVWYQKTGYNFTNPQITTVEAS